jgi:NAD(P)-dependent dehydrogenase (short-subunit alcohol dehydrogenase family)
MAGAAATDAPMRQFGRLEELAGVAELPGSEGASFLTGNALRSMEDFSLRA